MIEIKNEDSKLIEISVKDTLESEDFCKLGEIADNLIKKHGNVRVIVDASNFNGWANIDAAEKHFGFVKDHHQKVERLAIIVGHMWQHWVVAMARVFLHPDVKLFDKGQVKEARQWIKQ